ncbi:MAG: Brp/Blh family beta-carotene 15,15'-dioxygenase [Planctomycetota bacterium]
MTDARAEAALDAHWRWAAGGTAVAVLLLAALPTPSPSAQFVVLAVGVALLGFPHGALDPLVASIGGALRSPARLAVFLASYLGLAGLAFALWLTAPGVALAAFLVYSGVHFGLGDVDAYGSNPPRALRLARVVVHGAAPILHPVAAYPAEAAELFGILAGAEATRVQALVESAAPVALGAWIALAVASYAWPACWPGRRQEWRGAGELALLVAAFWVAPPLVSFSIYFCVWHSVRHFVAVDRAVQGVFSLRAVVVGLAVLAGTLLLLGGGHLSAGLSGNATDVVRTVFVALACLTPPHMLVTSMLAREPMGAEESSGGSRCRPGPSHELPENGIGDGRGSVTRRSRSGRS